MKTRDSRELTPNGVEEDLCNQSITISSSYTNPNIFSSWRFLMYRSCFVYFVQSTTISVPIISRRLYI